METHPADTLQDTGCRLLRLEGFHPSSEKVSGILKAIGFRGELTVSPLPPGQPPHLVAHLQTLRDGAGSAGLTRAIQLEGARTPVPHSSRRRASCITKRAGSGRRQPAAGAASSTTSPSLWIAGHLLRTSCADCRPRLIHALDRLDRVGLGGVLGWSSLDHSTVEVPSLLSITRISAA